MRLSDTRTNRAASRLANAAASTPTFVEQGHAALQLATAAKILIASLEAIRDARDELAQNGSEVLALRLNHHVRRIKAAIEAVSGRPAPKRPGDRTASATRSAGA